MQCSMQHHALRVVAGHDHELYDYHLSSYDVACNEPRHVVSYNVLPRLGALAAMRTMGREPRECAEPAAWHIDIIV